MVVSESTDSSFWHKYIIGADRGGETSVGPGSLQCREQAGRNKCRNRRTQAMNVDREDELRIQAPPGAASASENRLLLDGTGLTPEAQSAPSKTRKQQKKKFARSPQVDVAIAESES